MQNDNNDAAQDASIDDGTYSDHGSDCSTPSSARGEANAKSTISSRTNISELPENGDDTQPQLDSIRIHNTDIEAVTSNASDQSESESLTNSSPDC